MRTDRYIRIGVISISGLILAISTAYTVFGNLEYRRNKAEQAVAYSIVQQDAESAKAAYEDTVAMDDVTVHSAKAAGDAVAKIANEMTNAMVRIYTVPDTNPEGRADLMDEFVSKLSPQMDAYFGEGNTLRTAWWTTSDATVLSGVNWSFQTTYNFVDDMERVLWVAHDAKGGIVAYVTALYHADTDTFDSYAKHETTYGGLLQRGTDSGSALPEVSQDISGIMAMVGDTAPDLFPDEVDKAYQEQISDPEYQAALDEQRENMEAIKESVESGHTDAVLVDDNIDAASSVAAESVVSIETESAADSISTGISSSEEGSVS